MALPEGLATYAWVLVATVVAPTVFGAGLLRWLGLAPAHGLRFLLSCGYVIGHYVLAHGTLVWLLLHQPGPGWLLPVVATALGLWLWRRSRRSARPLAERTPSPWWSWLPVAVLVLWLFDAFMAKNAEPVRFSDEAVNWAAKAKVLYGAPGFALKAGLDHYVEHPDYPLFNPLVQVLAFASVGRVLHFENRLPIQFFGVALLLLLSAATVRRAHVLPATLALVAFAGSSFAMLTTTAYADVVLACCTLVMADALLRLRESREPVFVPIACFAMGAMISTKNEGLLLAVAVMVPFGVDRLLAWWRSAPSSAPRIISFRQLPWFAVPLAALLLHRAMNAWFAIQNDMTNPALGGGRGLVTRIGEQFTVHGPAVASYYGRMLVDPGLHRLLPLAFLVAAPVALCRQRRAWLAAPGGLLFAAFAMATGGYALVFIGTIYDLTWHLDVAADRTMQHVLPLVVIGLCATVWPRQPAGPPVHKPPSTPITCPVM